MTLSKDQIIVWSDRLYLAQILQGAPRNKLTTILYHQFQFGEESQSDARDRLSRQCEFLAESYYPLSIDEAAAFVTSDRVVPDYPLLVTIDDAKAQIIDYIDIFEEFEIPLALFICAGWSDLSAQSRLTERDPLGFFCRLLSRLHFYEGDERSIRLNGQEFRLDRAGNAALIDAVITANAEGTLAGTSELVAFDQAAPDYNQICNWRELRELASRKITLGVHSVSHPQIAHQTPLRQRAEIMAGKQLIETHLGLCSHFAYPYGIPGSYDAGTGALLREAGFTTGFTTMSAFCRQHAPMHELPRIPLPDRPMSQATFEARVQGGGIFLSQLKRGFR